MDCWPVIINEIINFFRDYIFRKKEDSQNEVSESNDKIKDMDDNDDNLFNNIEASKNKISESKDKIKDFNEKFDLFNNIEEKKFIIIFDNILEEEENKLVENIIENCSTSNFIFFIIYPLINDFTSNQFIKYIHKSNDSSSLFFANINDFNSKGPENKIKENSSIFEKNTEEIIISDLIRIFNFKSIFVDSFNYNINSQSLEFLIRYIEYLNIQFDNKNKKIINVAFKNKNIEEVFKDRYIKILTTIRAKNNIKYNDIIGQRDGYDIEKIIISEIISKKREKFEILELKSIFGLKGLEKKEDINYKNSNFFLKQKSLCAEMFDFGFKIIKDNKQYLKLIQVTSDKTEDEKDKISIEKITINSSYLINEFQKNELGDINGISFCIIAPLRILDNENKNKYNNLKKFCKENNYQFLLYDLNNSLFYKRIARKNYEKDLFEIDEEFQLNITNFNSIIKINKDLQILSLRRVKDRDENKEDSEAKEEAKKYINQNIKRIAKFEYSSNFTDLKELKENYFGYIYWKKDIYVYFYKNEIVKNIQNKDYSKYKDLKLILILYSTEVINENYCNSSEEKEIDKDAIKKKKISKKLDKKNPLDTNQRSNNYYEEIIDIDEEKQDKKVIKSKNKKMKNIKDNKFLNKKKSKIKY